MNDLTFAKFAKQADIPRTTVYTRLNTIKELDEDTYNSFITTNEDRTLAVKYEKINELADLLSPDNYDKFVSSFKTNKNKEREMAISDSKIELITDKHKIEMLSEQLKHEKEKNEMLLSDNSKQSDRIKELQEEYKTLSTKYDELFSNYVKQSEHLQNNNNELTTITKAQQLLMSQEQLKTEKQQDVVDGEFVKDTSQEKPDTKKGFFAKIFK